MTKTSSRPRWAIPVVAGALGAVTLLSGCSGTGSAAGTIERAGSSTAPAGPCDKALFARHSGLAAGAVQIYVWRPVTSGALKKDAKGRATALETARRASTLAAHELAVAAPLVTGCPAGTRLVNALATGRSLLSSASKQLASASVNRLTLAGANSITATVLQEAKLAGISVAPTKPTAAQLAAGSAG